MVPERLTNKQYPLSVTRALLVEFDTGLIFFAIAGTSFKNLVSETAKKLFTLRLVKALSRSGLGWHA